MKFDKYDIITLLGMAILGLAEKRLNVEFQYNTIGCSMRNA